MNEQSTYSGGGMELVLRNGFQNTLVGFLAIAEDVILGLDALDVVVRHGQ